MNSGAHVVILVGRLAGHRGQVVFVDRSPRCRCVTVVVRTVEGAEWVGKPAELRVEAVA